jgi:hypothetical protein
MLGLALVGDARTFVVISSGIAAPLSLGISVLALMTSRQQARYSELSTANAYQPVVLPVHEAVPVSSDTNRPERYYPAIRAFTIPAVSPSEGVFVVDRRTGQAVLHLRNVGRGPAVLVSSELQDHAGRRAKLIGNPVIGPDRGERYCAAMPDGMAAPADGCGPRSAVLCSLWDSLLADHETKERAFFLRVEYRSMRPGAESDVVEAIYDPQGTGRWLVDLDTADKRIAQRKTRERKSPGLTTGARVS